MTVLPINPATVALARRLVWFEPPEQALADPNRLLSYAFRYAAHADMRTLRRLLGDDALRAALESSSAGILDGRSWAYWRLMLDLAPQPLPSRFIADGSVVHRQSVGARSSSAQR